VCITYTPVNVDGIVTEGPIGYLLGSAARLAGGTIGGIISDELIGSREVGVALGNTAGQVLGTVLSFIPF